MHREHVVGVSAHVCADSDARCLIVDSMGEAAMAELDALPEIVITLGRIEAPEGARVVSYTDLVAGSTGPPAPGGPALGDDLILYYSSGTTGLPKAAVHTPNGVLWNSFARTAESATAQEEHTCPS